jgi:hypothetical protein
MPVQQQSPNLVLQQLDDDGGRAEDLLLQQRVTSQQQVCIGPEDLCPRLPTDLFATGQSHHPRVSQHGRNAIPVVRQTTGVQHGLGCGLVDRFAQALHEAIETG